MGGEELLEQATAAVLDQGIERFGDSSCWLQESTVRLCQGKIVYPHLP